MAGIDLGIALQSKTGSPELDAIIQSPQPMQKDNGSPWRVKFDGPEHILTIGPTRSGKGRRLLAPELIHDTDRSIIVAGSARSMPSIPSACSPTCRASISPAPVTTRCAGSTRNRKIS
jgi:hypothetical protein